MGNQDRECGHGIYRYRLRYFGCQALSKERNPALGFTTRWEKFSLVLLISLSHKERRSSETTSSAGASVYLMVEEFLDVVDGEEMFTIHGDDDCVPNLEDENLHWIDEELLKQSLKRNLPWACPWSPYPSLPTISRKLSSVAVHIYPSKGSKSISSGWMIGQ